MIKRCEICGRPFTAKRSTARYCSGACRQRAHRAFSVPPQAAYAAPAFRDKGNLTVDELADVVQQARLVVADLSRASMYTPAPLCFSLGNVAAKLAKALNDEGL